MQIMPCRKLQLSRNILNSVHIMHRIQKDQLKRHSSQAFLNQQLLRRIMIIVCVILRERSHHKIIIKIVVVFVFAVFGFSFFGCFVVLRHFKWVDTLSMVWFSGFVLIQRTESTVVAVSYSTMSTLPDWHCDTTSVLWLSLRCESPPGVRIRNLGQCRRKSQVVRLQVAIVMLARPHSLK